ncbi:MAG TPA: hypothetical protein PLJ89_06435 [Thermoleophilia bacterium]|nr:hypothetical protein [Thermoleophilia bacterium]HQH21719.1 hypothetical protein [Thermoleophilia bacterium]
MMVVAVNGWDLSCYIMGAVAIVGPCTIAFWFFEASRQRFRDLSEAHKERMKSNS